jgi:hypothetical protein
MEGSQGQDQPGGNDHFEERGLEVVLDSDIRHCDVSGAECVRVDVAGLRVDESDGVVVDGPLVEGGGVRNEGTWDSSDAEELEGPLCFRVGCTKVRIRCTKVLHLDLGKRWWRGVYK